MKELILVLIGGLGLTFVSIGLCHLIAWAIGEVMSARALRRMRERELAAALYDDPAAPDLGGAKAKVVKLDERERAGRLFGYYVRTKLCAGCQPRDCALRPPVCLDEVLVVAKDDVHEVAGDEKPSVVCGGVPPLDGPAAGAATLAELKKDLFDGDVDLAIIYHANRAVLVAAGVDQDGMMFAEGDVYMRLPALEGRHAVQVALHEGGGGDERGRDGRGGGDDD